MKIKRRFTSVPVGARSRQEATCFEAAENSKLSSCSGHQRSNVPSAQLGRNSIPWLMLFLPNTLFAVDLLFSELFCGVLSSYLIETDQKKYLKKEKNPRV